MSASCFSVVGIMGLLAGFVLGWVAGAALFPRRVRSHKDDVERLRNELRNRR